MTKRLAFLITVMAIAYRQTDRPTGRQTDRQIKFLMMITAGTVGHNKKIDTHHAVSAITRQVSKLHTQTRTRQKKGVALTLPAKTMYPGIDLDALAAMRLQVADLQLRGLCK